MGSCDTEYGRKLRAQLAAYRAEHHLKIDHANHNRCERHGVKPERDRVTTRQSRYSCPVCIEELCAYQLALSHQWREAHCAQEPIDEMDVPPDADLRRSAG